MSDVTIKQLATVLAISADKLLSQLSEAGMVFEDEDQVVSSTDKVRLLGFLRRNHRADQTKTTAAPISVLVPDETDQGIDEEAEDEGLVIDRPFDPEKIKVKTVSRTVDLMIRRIDHDEVDLAPEFQRRARVWSIRRKSQLIESLLLRIPLPVFYVAADQSESWSVVDGLQRLTTIYDYIKGEYALKGLEYLAKLDGRKFEDLPRPMRRRIEESELVIHVIEPGTPEAVMINIFKRINTGGVPLTGQEIRNALNKGPAREFLRELASGKAFSDATDGSVNDERMDAQECVLRFAAFRMTPPEEYQSNDLDGFLNSAMRRLNEISDEERSSIESDFNRSMYAASDIFNHYAFRKMYSTELGRRNRVSKALFEAWSVNLAGLNSSDLLKLIDNKARVIDLFVRAMKEDRTFEVSVSYSTGAPQRVQKRFAEVSKIISRAIHD